MKKETTDTVNVDEFTLKELILSIRDWIRYFLSKWYWITLFSILGGLAGFWYASFKKPVYTATSSFVLETGGSSGGRLSSYAGIASAFGIDLTGAGGSLFEGENILELYRSRNMITRSLLTEYDFGGKKKLLIDRYIEYKNLRKKWNKKDDLRDIKFNADNRYPSPRIQIVHDSIMINIVKEIEKNLLKVFKKDTKLNIIYVTVASDDELFAKAFNEMIVQTVNRFYADTKTKKSIDNVEILQRKADSLRSAMTGAVYRAAVVADATPNQNPTRMVQRTAPIQNAKYNAEINQAILETVLQNLELGKINLQKETPLVQIVDQPVLPLEKKEIGKVKGTFVGGLLGGILILLIVSIKRYLH